MENNNPSVIDIQHLRMAVNAIFDHIENDLNIRDIPLSNDFYWNVPDASLYKVEADVGELDIGSLFDDLSFTGSILKEKSAAVSLMLIHVAPLLRYLAQKIGQ